MTNAELERLREENARLAREAYTWSKAAETYAADAESLRARIAELHECLTKCAESAYEAGVADERERHAKLRTVAVQVLRDMRSHGLLLELQTLLDEAL